MEKLESERFWGDEARSRMGSEIFVLSKNDDSKTKNPASAGFSHLMEQLGDEFFTFEPVSPNKRSPPVERIISSVT